MDMGMVPWVGLVVCVALVIRFTVEWILRRLGVQRVEPDQPNGLQHMARQVEQWAHNRRAQSSAGASSADGGTDTRSSRRAERARDRQQRDGSGPTS